MTSTTPPLDVSRVIADEQHEGKNKWKIWLVLVALLTALVIAWFMMSAGRTNTPPGYLSSAADRGTIQTSIVATGNLAPVNQVDIGVELSGTVEAVLVDTNDEVVFGQELARLNTDQLTDTVVKSEAALASANARVRQAQATTREAQVSLKRLQNLSVASGGRLPALADLDSARASYDRAKADEAVSRTDVESAKATVRSAKSNLSKAIITSPIEGVVLDRAVEPGQTVASSLNTPTLFTLAEDLSKMELEVSVDEADVGQVSDNQDANFTVDAWPGRLYPAKVTRVSLGSTVTDNVVSYVTTLNVSNTDLTLRPGMTATATIITQKRDDVLRIPNAALRYSPATTAAPTAVADSSMISRILPRMPRQADKKREAAPVSAGSEKTIWVQRGLKAEAIAVTVGISDGKFTEVLSGALQAGDKVVTGEQQTAP